MRKVLSSDQNREWWKTNSKTTTRFSQILCFFFLLLPSICLLSIRRRKILLLFRHVRARSFIIVALFVPWSFNIVKSAIKSIDRKHVHQFVHAVFVCMLVRCVQFGKRTRICWHFICLFVIFGLSCAYVYFAFHFVRRTVTDTTQRTKTHSRITFFSLVRHKQQFYISFRPRRLSSVHKLPIIHCAMGSSSENIFFEQKKIRLSQLDFCVCVWRVRYLVLFISFSCWTAANDWESLNSKNTVRTHKS